MKRWCGKPPKGVSCMAMSPDGRYVYCLGQTIFVFDRETGGKQRLPGMGNAVPFVSADGRFLGGVHPCRTARESVEVTLWGIGETHTELLPRKRIRSQVPPAHACFTADGAYILLDATVPVGRTGRCQTQLWAVSTADGNARMLDLVPEQMSLRSVAASAHGILLMVQDTADAAAHCQLMLLPTVDAEPQILPIDVSGLMNLPVDAEQPTTVGEYWRGSRLPDCRACWLPDGRVLLEYRALAVHLQTISPGGMACIYPRAEMTVPGGFFRAISPDGLYFATGVNIAGRMAFRVAVFRMADGVQTFSLESRFLWDLSFSPDGQWLLVSGEEPVMEPRASWE